MKKKILLFVLSVVCLAALLGAFKAQMNLGIGSIGGKDSMSGSFEDLDVPPTLVSFAVTTQKVADIVSPEFKKAGNRLVLLKPNLDENGLPDISGGCSEQIALMLEKSVVRSGEVKIIFAGE